MRASLRRFALVVGLVVLVAPLLVVAALHVPAVQRVIIGRVLSSVREGTGLDVQARRIRIVPFRLAVVADDLVVTTVGHDGPPVLTATRVEVDAARALLTSRGTRLAFDGISLIRPVVWLARDQAGQWNLPVLPDPADESATPDFDISRLRIDDGRVRVVDPVAGYDLDVGDLSLTTALTGFDTTASFRVAASEREVAGTLTGLLSLADGTLRARQLAIETARSSIHGEAALDLDAGTHTLDVTASADLREFAPMLGMPDASGTVQLGLRSEGSVATPNAVWRVEAIGLTDGQLPETALDGRGEATSERIVVEALTVRTMGGQAVASGVLGLTDTERTDLDVTVRGVRLETALRAYAPDVPATAVVSARLTAAGPGLAWTAWDGGGQVLLRSPGGPAAAGVLPLDGPIDVTLKDGRWSMRANVAVPEAAVLVADVSGTLGTPLTATTITGNLRGDVDDLAAFLARVAPDVAPVGGRVSMDLQVSGDVASPRTTWTAAAEVTPPLLTTVTVDAAGTLTAALLEVDRIDATAGVNEIRGALTLGLDGTRPLRGTIEADLQDLASLAADPTAFGWPLAGTGRVSASLSGSLDAPQLTGAMALERLEYAGQRVDELRADVSARWPRVALAEIDGRAGSGRIAGRAEIDLATERIASDLTITDWPVNRIPPATAARVPDDEGIPIEAVVSGTVSLQGPWRAPSGSVSLDASRLAWERHDLGPLTVRAELDGTTAAATFGASRLHLSGVARLALVGDPIVDVDARLDALTLEPLRPWIPDTLAGAEAVVSAVLQARARLDDPLGTATGELTLTDVQLAIGEARLALEAPASVRMGATRLDIDGLRLRTGELQLDVRGGLASTSPGPTLTFALDGPIAAVEPWLKAFDVEAPQVEGYLSLLGEVAGNWHAPRPSATLTTTNVQVTQPGVPTVHVMHEPLHLRDGVLTLDNFVVRWQDAEARAAGRVPLRLLASAVPEAYRPWFGTASGPAELDVRTDPIDLAVLQPLLPAGALDGITGRVAVTAAVEASGPSLADLEGLITFTEASFTLAGLPFEQGRPTILRLEDHQLVLRDVFFTGVNTDIAVDGVIDLAGETPSADLLVRGLTDLALLRPFLPDAVPGGRAEIDLRATGTLDDPRVTGQLILTDASLALREPRLVVEQLNGTATFTGRQMAMPALRGFANGAPVSISAALALGTDNTPGGQVRVRGSGVPLEYPEGFRTEADVDLLASLAGSRMDVTGSVEVLRGLYREPVVLATLSSSLLGGVESELLPAAGPAALDVRFGIDVTTRDDIVVDNNYGRFAAGAALRLIGTLDEPALSGRVSLREGGELYLSGQTYRIERGAIDFANPTRIEPILDVAVETRVRGERIRVEATGTPDTLDVSLSAPDATTPRSQADLASMLVSGRAVDELTGAAAGEQALGLLTGDLLGVVGRGVGLDTLRLERELAVDDRLGTGEADVAAETDPVARLTLAKRLRSDVELVFSQNLRDANAITWLVTWTPLRRTEVRFLQRDDRSVSYELRREAMFGEPPGQARSSAPSQPRVREVALTAPDPAMQRALQARLSLRAGRRFDFFRWQDDRDRLAHWLESRGHFEHRIVARRDAHDEVDGPVVDLTYDVMPGPVCRVEVQGETLDGRTHARMQDAWVGSVYDGFLVDDLTRIAREALLARGYPMAAVETTVAHDDRRGEKVATVAIATGASLTRRTDVAGLEGSLATRFTDYLARGGDRLAWLDPPLFQTEARRWLRSRGALDADVAVGDPTVDGATATRLVRVDGGEAYRIGRIDVAGTPAVRVQQVRDQLGLSADDHFDALELALARRDVERWYAAEGFRQAGVTVIASPREEVDLVDVAVTVEERAREIVVETRVDGARVTRRALLDRALALPEGTVVSPEHVLAARKRLYDTGVLATVDVHTEPIGPTRTADDGTEEQPVRVVGDVREIARLRLRYGLAVNDDVLQEDAFRATSTRRATPGLSALLENRNLFGRALTGGLAARYERARQSGRSFLTLPDLFGRDLRLQVSTGIARSRLIPDSTASPIDVRTDATFGATQGLPGLEGLRLTYGYRYERSRTYDPADPDLFDITIAAPRLQSTVFVDRRDDAIDATRGWFHASTVEFTRAWLASDFEFVKYYAQQSIYQRLGRAVLAGRAQVGLGRGFGGQNLLGSERFTAGGAVSVRGYGEDQLGELDPILGVGRGDGLLVVNGEARVPLWRWLQGVGFVDAGGVFNRMSDMGTAGLRWGTGAGLRVSTPAGLLRVDFGVPVNRRPSDDRWRVYVGLGQIF